MRSTKNLYLPIEGLARELDGKLLLALTARERGWRPVIGYKYAIRNRRAVLPPGVFLSHNARRRKPDVFNRMAQFGHQTAVLDEEALVRQTDEIFLMKHDRDAFDRVRLVLTWGEDDAELWRQSRRVDPGLVVVTGNPRMDMLRRELRAFHEPEIESIRSRFGDYVLLNTNFATVNHFVPHRSTLVLAGSAVDERVAEQAVELLHHKQALFERFLAIVPAIARAIAPLRLVIRPHPSERWEPWLKAIAGSSNTAVVAEGSVVPWLAGARALVQNGCTSAVESAVIGTPVLSYRPVRSDVLDNSLPNRVGIECLDEDSLLGSLTHTISGGRRPIAPEQSRVLQHHVASISGALSCERIMDALDSLPMRSDRQLGYLEMLGRQLQLHWREQSRRLKNTLTSAGRIRLAYVHRKTSEMTAEYLNDRICRFQGALERFEGRRAKPIAENLFAIE